MKAVKYGGCALLLLLLCFSMSVLAVYSVRSSGALSLSMTTDRASYDSGDRLRVSLRAENTGGEVLSNLVFRIDPPVSYVPAASSPSPEKEFWSLSAGSEAGITVFLTKGEETAEPELSPGFAHWFETNAVPIGLAGLLVSGLGIIAVFLLLPKRRVLLAVLLVFVLLVSALSPALTMGVGLVDDRRTFTDSVTVSVDGEDIVIPGTVTFRTGAPRGERPAETHTVVFWSDGGTEIPFQEVETGAFAMAPETVPVKDGAVFAGWYADKALSQLFVFADTPILEDTTLYARWADSVYVLDSDGDGVYDLDELAWQSDPYQPDDLIADSDSDGLPDYYERSVLGTDPANPDTDGDGLSDSVEVKQTATDPLLPDTTVTV